MKLLFDENLSPSLAWRLIDLFPESMHVHDCHLGKADDLRIWNFAKENGYTIISKDSDHYDFGIMKGHPPKVIWLRTGNCSTSKIEHLLKENSETLVDFFNSSTDSVFIMP